MGADSPPAWLWRFCRRSVSDELMRCGKEPSSGSNCPGFPEGSALRLFVSGGAGTPPFEASPLRCRSRAWARWKRPLQRRPNCDPLRGVLAERTAHPSRRNGRATCLVGQPI